MSGRLQVAAMCMSLGAWGLGRAQAVEVATAAKPARTPTEDSIVYGTAAGQSLTMDYYAPKGRGPHPVAIIIHGGGYTGGTSRNGSEAYCADFLAPAGYAVFSINYRLAPQFPYPANVEDTKRAVRFIRHNAARWQADGSRIALIGGSAGGFLSNMVGLLGAGPVAGSSDPIDRESARAQAVVTLFAQSSFAAVPLNDSTHALLDAEIARVGQAEALRNASPITYVSPMAPPFLQIIGDHDEYIPLAEATNLDTSLKRVGVSSEVIVIPGGRHATGSWYRVPGVPDWEKQMTIWLDGKLHYRGPVGEGIRAREPKPSAK